MIIVFLGVDGSGKSTIIKDFCNEIENEWTEIKYVHFRPSYIVKSHENNNPITNPHEGPNRGPIMSIIKLLYFILEYNYAFLMHYRKPGQLVIFDRYYYDILADPQRVKISLPAWVINFLMNFIPSPDLVFYLFAPVDILYERKKEKRKNDLKKILVKYSSLADIHNFYKISTENSIQSSLSDIKLIYKPLKEKFN